ncbi:MAG: holo-ACP synthase [Gloeocapsa sp. UFS-A4-WI-NPMV-4B04]|jgi:holo-[acyl-carrier protein] synthase|nr:holo-ACP synthase [Gloeocapsa sp. UFS-A4-WI-NPMV-4B04]
MIRLGTDIVYIPRIQAAIDRFGDRFLQRVYTPKEQLDCGYTQQLSINPLASRLLPLASRSINQLAGRWAAKEAVVKALGTGWRGVGYTDIEIERELSGAPSVHLHQRAAIIVATWGESQWQLSLSHDQDYAIATALLICSPQKP